MKELYIIIQPLYFPDQVTIKSQRTIHKLNLLQIKIQYTLLEPYQIHSYKKCIKLKSSLVCVLHYIDFFTRETSVSQIGSSDPKGIGGEGAGRIAKLLSGIVVLSSLLLRSCYPYYNFAILHTTTSFWVRTPTTTTLWIFRFKIMEILKFIVSKFLWPWKLTRLNLVGPHTLHTYSNKWTCLNHFYTYILYHKWGTIKLIFHCNQLHNFSRTI